MQTKIGTYFKNEFVQDLNEYKLFRKTKTKWLQKDRFPHEIFSNNTVIKLKRFQKVAWVQTPHRLCQWKFKLWVGKFAWGVKAKHCLALSTNFWKQKVCWHHPAIFYLITSSKLSLQLFELSLKVKVMGLNPSYLLKSFLLYKQFQIQWCWYQKTAEKLHAVQLYTKPILFY